MKTFWIVVADAGRALIFTKKIGGDPAMLLQELQNPAGRLHTSELVSDQRGRVDKSSGGVQSAADPHTDPHEQMAINFARRVCRVIDFAGDRDLFDALVLVAPPHFLGLLHTYLGRVAQTRLFLSEAKDRTNAALPDLQRYVDELLNTSGAATNA